MKTGFLVVACAALILSLAPDARADVCFLGSNTRLMQMVAQYDNVSFQAAAPDSLDARTLMQNLSGKCGWVIVYADAPSGGLSGKKWVLNSLSSAIDVVWSGYPPELPCVETYVTVRNVTDASITVPDILLGWENVSSLRFYEIEKQEGVQEIGVASYGGVNQSIVFKTNEKRIYYFSFDLSETPALLKAVAVRQHGAAPWIYTPSTASPPMDVDNSSNITVWDVVVFGGLSLLIVLSWILSRRYARRKTLEKKAHAGKGERSTR